MLVPLSWLRDYVPLPADPAALIERLTLAGLEAAGTQVFGVPAPTGIRVKEAGLVWERDKVVLAKVLKIEKHPDADKLKLVTVDYGAAEPKTVVTGAPNIAPGESGMKVVLGLRGTKYFYTDKEGKKTTFTLEPKALRGIMNDAMCMSNFELGISEEHEGIIILDDVDPAPGTPIQDVLGDIVVELDVLPNMARCLSLIGIAREVAALTGATCTIAASEPAGVSGRSSEISIEIADPKLCARYTATLLRDVKLGPSPRWLRSRLQSAGMRPINNLVDITNYVMLEHGQPLHAFDYDVLVQRAGGKPPVITVRSAKPGETLKTLDGQTRELTAENLVIADGSGPIALAGVMGGHDTEVTATTKTVLLESASFDFVSVRRTARQFTLFSEASTRFSKGIHPEVVLPAAVRAAQLFHQIAGATVLSDVVDNYPAPIPPQIIELKASEIRRLLGFDIPAAEVERVLTALQFQVKPAAEGWTVTVPQTRLDIQAGAADLIEELARVYGYDKLPESQLSLALPEQTGNRSLELEERVKDLLADQGLQECITYSMGPPIPAEEHSVELLNPISPERSVLRTELWPGLLEVAAQNLLNTDSVSLFELGPVFVKKSGQVLPEEPKSLGIVLSGRRTAASWDDPQGVKPAAFDFYDLKGIVESLAADLHLPKVTIHWFPNASLFHPGKSAVLQIDGHAVGGFGELHPKLAEKYGLAERSVLVAELELDVILKSVPERFPYKPFPTVPPAKRDIAMIVAEDVPMEKVLGELRAAGGDLLADAVLFDVYKGESIPAGTKSLAFALVYQAADRTLGEKEIEKAHQKIESRLRHVLKAQIRGKD